MWPWSARSAYDRLQDGEPESQALNNNSNKHGTIALPISSGPSLLQQLRDAALAITALLCLWIALVAAWRTTLHPVPTRDVRYETKILRCGNSTREAEAHGCVYDLLSHNWIPPPCMDYEIVEEFRDFLLGGRRSMGSWPYFYDRVGKRRIEDEHALAHTHTVYATLEEHMAHCEFLLRRIHRAAAGFAKLDGYIAGYEHTLHCINMLKNPGPGPFHQITEVFWTSFSNCTVEVPTW